MAKQTDNQVSAVRRAKHGWILTLFFSILAVFYLYPIFLVLINSLKKKGFIMKSPFALPDERSFFGMTNFVKGIEKTNFFAAFGNSVIITVGSVAVIIFCTSMCAWFITRVHNKFTMALYMLCLFSMIVPFQMVMFPLSKLANMMHLSNPIGIILVYLGFGAGLAVFMFCGFVKSIPLEIEEAAKIDGANEWKTFTAIAYPMIKPGVGALAIFTFINSWNDYFMQLIMLSSTSNLTISLGIAKLQAENATDFGLIMAGAALAAVPIIVVFLIFQKYFTKGITMGAVKG